MNRTLRIFLLALFLLHDFLIFAQPTDEDDNGDLEGNDVPTAPIGSKIYLLIIVGIVFVFFKLRRHNEQKEI